MADSQWPESFIQEVADKRVVVVVGAGASQDCPPKPGFKRLPGWEAFLRGGAALLVTKKKRDALRFINRGQLLEAADYILAHAPPGDWTQYVRRELNHKNVILGEVYSLLLKLDAKVYITPNVDRVLEVYAEGADANYQVVLHTEKRLGKELRTPSPLILKYHGTVNDIDNMVFGRKQFYEAKAQNPDFYSIVEGLVLTNTLLFVGHSLRDPDLALWLESAGMNARRGLPNYALMEKMHEVDRELLRDVYNVVPIEYPKGKYDVAKDILRDLSERVDDLRAIRVGP